MVVDGRPTCFIIILAISCMLTICYIGNNMIDITGTRLSVYVQNQIIRAYIQDENKFSNI